MPIWRSCVLSMIVACAFWPLAVRAEVTENPAEQAAAVAPKEALPSTTPGVSGAPSVTAPAASPITVPSAAPVATPASPAVASPVAAPLQVPSATSSAGTPDAFAKRIGFEGTWQNLLHYRNRYDFSDQKLKYGANGKEVGFIGTFFRPRLTFELLPNLRAVWEVEIGLNVWSRNDPAQYSAAQSNAFLFANRELFLEGHFNNDLWGFKVGYQKFYDPSGLFLGHWVGAGTLIVNPKAVKISVSAGQLPDQTYEGVTLERNNFNHDATFYGLRFDVPWQDKLMFSASAYGLHDTRVVRQTLDLATITAHLDGTYKWAGEANCFKAGADFDFQGGSWKNRAENDSQSLAAWALQAFATLNLHDFGLEYNLLVMSADDDHLTNKRNGAFLYSGKSRSRTLILTEDELRDRGGNLDEAIGTDVNKNGSFFSENAGLMVTDLTLSYQVAEFFTPSLILGVGTVLNSSNAAGNTLVGVEGDLDLLFTYRKVLDFHLTGGILVPGKAASIRLNNGGYSAQTKNQYMFETSVAAHF